ncbi:cytochrome c oxidase subunit NDUFA4-like [Cebus imitator]|uniref:cytochrome c oxidase subunit NDUFA4-like n=1 Tax=Cebus imitator TaxID=2715852 RepID=UPI00189A038B|nr:cytochrome c oxidase subunit NDUFA4-like [Cebus imitator]
MLYHILNQAKKQLSMILLFELIGDGGTGVALYVLHPAWFNPDVTWDRKNNPEPGNKLGPSNQYKFYSVNVDYSKPKKEGLVKLLWNEGLLEAISTIVHLTKKFLFPKCMKSC